jgi:hypothetical protein
MLQDNSISAVSIMASNFADELFEVILLCSVATVVTDAFQKNGMMSRGNWLKL